MAQSADRTGRKAERDEYLDKIIQLFPDSGYGQMAKEWKADPAASATTNISCKSCHAQGRLAERMAVIEAK